MYQHHGFLTDKQISLLFIRSIQQNDERQSCIRLVDAYGFRAASEAKTVLISECNKVSIIDSIAEFSIKLLDGRFGSLRRVIGDTVDIWTVVDRERKGELAVTFVADVPNPFFWPRSSCF